VGLNYLLNTDVESNREKSSFYQLNRLKLSSMGKVQLGKQINLDYLARCIGFEDEAVKTYRIRKTIYVNAPTHPATQRKKGDVEVPSMVCAIIEEMISGFDSLCFFFFFFFFFFRLIVSVAFFSFFLFFFSFFFLFDF